MGKYLTSVLFISSMIIACSTSANKKMIKDKQQLPAGIETKTNTSSSAAKASEPGDSVVIKPVHKYKHPKKLKLK
jgi:hypothetical protein